MNRYTDIPLSQALLVILLFTFITLLCVFMNVPVFRELSGFAFLTLVPGFFILLIIKPLQINSTEKFVLAIGLSISFIMLFGLLINWLYPLFGYNTPLSENSVVISFAVSVLTVAAIAYLRNRNTPLTIPSIFNLSTKEKAWLLIPSLFPLISILGSYLINAANNNIVLIILLLLIPAYLIAISIKHKDFPVKLYSYVILLTSVSLILMLALRSNHIIGVDTHQEYYIFQQTLQNKRWQIVLNDSFDSCLSISILPTVYKAFTNIDSEYLFKTIYPVLFTIAPLVIYLIAKRYIKSFYALLASFFFMSQALFLDVASNARTVIAILFFALCIMILFNNNLKELNKRLLFSIFAISCIISHYSTSYIFFFVLFITWLFIQLIKKVPFFRKYTIFPQNPRTQEDNPKLKNKILIDNQTQNGNTVTIGKIIFFFAVIFFWQSQIINIGFTQGVKFITNTFTSMHHFFILDMRDPGVRAAFGNNLGVKTIPAKIEFVVSWLSIAFIAIGVIAVIVIVYRSLTASKINFKSKSPLLSLVSDTEFLLIALSCSLILVVSVALPYILVGYGQDRIYEQMMVVLSSFFTIGGFLLAKAIRTRYVYVVILLVLIPFFMCNTGTMYQLFGVHKEITLTSTGEQYAKLYTHDQDLKAISFLTNVTIKSEKIYADFFGTRRLISNGLINRSFYAEDLIISNRTIVQKGYFYLQYSPVVYGQLIDYDHQFHDLIKYKQEFITRDLIYNNSASEVWY